MPRTGDPYASCYQALSDVREEFHCIGQFDDAGATLDELSKLLVRTIASGAGT